MPGPYSSHDVSGQMTAVSDWSAVRYGPVRVVRPVVLGTAKLANGSLIEGSGEIQLPVVPPRNPLGLIIGPPQAPKSLPVLAGPPLARSILAPPPRYAALGSLESTWTLCCGPPQMHNLLFTSAVESQPGAGLLAPCTVSALVMVGLRTRSGMGADACSTPQVEKARTSLVVLPLNRATKKVRT